MTITLALRASLLHYTDDPALTEDGIHWHADGLLLLEGEKIVAAGDYAALKHLVPDDLTVQHYPGKIIMPGFIDTHIHYPQTDMIASPAPGLLPWLEQYTFPTERQFQNPAHANDVASFFLDEFTTLWYHHGNGVLHGTSRISPTAHREAETAKAHRG